ncbi:sodium-dependent transporter [Clostridium sp. YIM B02515]|uniref:Transporter n=1 Tax=Clostridium rhizosphaerae TaxID=2803861 RepID=A0ABS1TFN7_9CLOT|nr:sodium-dependent transporter [Clostridium rhizosphaerae]MBL4938066.1 sodium-dependent transporter [Clostridium rhizosphaerae]
MAELNTKPTKKREIFSTGLAVFFATLGSAVGLGNIWKFPYVVGSNGGGAFLLIYFICVIFVGIPVMVCELYIGRKTRNNAVGTFKKLKPGSAWKGIGGMGVVTAFLIMFFYSDVSGWVYSYVFKSITGQLNGVTPDIAKAVFEKTSSGLTLPILWQGIVFIVVAAILIAGVKNGIERITKTLLPILFILIIICNIRAFTLSGAGDGLKFLYSVDFTKVNGGVILAALGLAFFKLSLGMGTMITYGSYFTEDNNLLHTPLKVALSDIAVSLLAGMAIFPVVFTFKMEPSSGPGLLFTTIPLVFSKLPLGNLLLVFFFILTAIAATTAMISLVEVPVAYFSEEKGMKRTNAVIFTVIIMFVIGTLATLSVNPSSFVGNIQILGYGFFDLFDKVSSNILMPIGGLLTAIFIGYFIRKDDLKNELMNNGTLSNTVKFDLFYFIMRYISPILLIIVFLSGLGIIKL